MIEDTLELEECKFCGAVVESPCDYSPPDFCEKAANVSYLTQEDFDIIEEREA